jgi:hypothetical protein
METVYVIVNGGAYVQSINPVNGQVRWTERAELAKTWRSKPYAQELADGIGYVRPLTVHSTLTR